MSDAGAPARACRHCRLPLASGSTEFCCSGCFLAWHLLGRARPEDARDARPARADGLLARLAVSAFLAMGVMVFSLSLYGTPGAPADETALALRGLARMGALFFSLPVLVLLGLPLADAVVRLRRFLSADGLVLAGSGAAFAASLWSTFTDGPHVYYDTATMVLVLVTLGRWLDARARERATGRLRELARERLRPVARVRGDDEQEVDLEALATGDLVRLRAGEACPVDGVVREGRSFVDASRLTGEERPWSLGPGERILAGSVLVDGTLVVEARALRGERVQDEVERVLQRALGTRARLVCVADRASALLLPLVALLAAGAVAWHWRAAGAESALLAGLSVVLIACPCALGLAAPLAFWCALGQAWRRGLLVRDAEVLERVARVRSVQLDKTGTLTDEALELTAVEPGPGLSAEAALALAAALEAASDHPIARALRAATRGRALPPVREARALPGIGVEGLVDGSLHRLVRAGTPDEGPTTDVALERARGGRLALLRFATRARPGAREAVRALERLGLSVVVLTGDAPGPARALASELGLAVEPALLPAQKAERAGARAARAMFVGDGLNDAPALAAAWVGVSMRHAAPRTLESASVHLLHADLAALPELVRLARRTLRVARLNLAWAFGYNAAGLWLAARGELSPVFAASAMVASSLFVVLASSRLVAVPPPARGQRVARTDSSDPALLAPA